MTKFWQNFISFSDVILLAMTILACGSSTGSDSSSSSTLTATLSSIQTNIFTSSCATAGCHSSASASGGLSLASGESFSNLVGVTSSQSSRKRVQASSSSQSYLINKLEGTQSSVGGSGSRMPLSGTALTTDQISKIKEWIDNGSANN